MNKINEKLNNHEKTLLTAVISAFRSIYPSQNSALNWYTERSASKSSVSHVSKSIKSAYYVPIFGSVFASALAFVMIITSQSNQMSHEVGTFQTKITPLTSEIQEITSFSVITADVPAQKTEEKHVLAKIDAQTRAVSRTQIDESFTDSLNVETSLKDLFQ